MKQILAALATFVRERTFVRSVYSEPLVETLFISAVAAVLLIRAYLALTGFPSLGGAGLHIAHVVWGGVLMLVGTVVLLVYMTRAARELAALLGGFGFGTFVDEVGKFITKDNDYFFQPAIAIIYVVFVLLFVVGKAATRRRLPSHRESLAQALEVLKHAVHEGLTLREREHVLQLLENCDQAERAVTATRVVVLSLDTIQSKEPGWIARIRVLPYEGYLWAVRQAWFLTAVVGLFLLQSVTTVLENILLSSWSIGAILWTLGAAATLSSLVFWRRGQASFRGTVVAGLVLATTFLVTVATVARLRDGLSVVAAANMLFSAASGVLVVIGIGLLSQSRVGAYRMFHRAVLITVLLTQVYAFYQHQLIALGGLVINIAILLCLRYMINQEEEREAAQHVILKRADSTTWERVARNR